MHSTLTLTAVAAAAMLAGAAGADHLRRAAEEVSVAEG